MANEQLIRSGKNLTDTQNQFVDYGASFQEGAQVIQDQLDKNVKAEKDAKKEEFVQKQLEYKQFLMEQDIEAKTMLYASEKAQLLDLYEDAGERGLIEDYDPNYDRNETWRDMGKRLKLVESIGDKEKLQGRIDNMVKAEGNWGNVLSASNNVAISNSSPEAQKIDLAIAAHQKKNGNTPPPIKEVGGRDVFELRLGDETIHIPVDQVVAATDANAANSVFGDYNEPITAAGIQSKVNDAINGDPQLFSAFENGYGNIDTVRFMFRNAVKTPEQIKEFGDSLFVQGGLDPTIYTNLDKDGNPDNGIQYNPEVLEEIMIGMVEENFGKQDPSKRPLSIEEQQAQADLEYRRSQTAKNLNQTGADGATPDPAVESAYAKFEQGDYNALKGLKGISDIKKNRKGVWEVLDSKGNVLVTAGTGNIPDGTPIKNFLGAQGSAQQGPITEDSAVDSYIQNALNVPYTN